MQHAAASARRTIAILSPDYLKSSFAAPEWAAAFAQDPEGMKRSLVPVRVRECALEGMLRTIVHINLVGLDEDRARKQLVDGLSAKRAKPDRRPAFPGEAEATRRTSRSPKPFPGKAAASSAPAVERARNAPYMPRVRGAISDLDRTRFVKQAFGTVQNHFQNGLEELARQPAIDVEFTRTRRCGTAWAMPRTSSIFLWRIRPKRRRPRSLILSRRRRRPNRRTRSPKRRRRIRRSLVMSRQTRRTPFPATCRPRDRRSAAKGGDV